MLEELRKGDVVKIDRKLRMIISKVMLVLGASLMSLSFYLHSYYANTYPKVPEVANCRVIPLNVHGTIVYLTEQENSTLTWIFLGAIACGLCGGVLWKQRS